MPDHDSYVKDVKNGLRHRGVRGLEAGSCLGSCPSSCTGTSKTVLRRSKVVGLSGGSMIPWTGVVELDIVRRVGKVSSEKLGWGGMKVARVEGRVSYTMWPKAFFDFHNCGIYIFFFFGPHTNNKHAHAGDPVDPVTNKTT